MNDPRPPLPDPAPAGGLPRKPLYLFRRITYLIIAAVILWFAWQLITWPNVEKLATKNPESTSFIRREARSRGVKPAPLDWASYDRLSANLKRAALVSGSAVGKREVDDRAGFRELHPRNRPIAHAEAARLLRSEHHRIHVHVKIIPIP